MKSKWQMIANPLECRVCSLCQLACSLQKDKTFNPSKAYVKISSVIKSSGELDVGISFTDECDGCGLCVIYCPYGALSRRKWQTPQTNSQGVVPKHLGQVH